MTFNFNAHGDNTKLFKEMADANCTTDKELEDFAKDCVDSSSDVDECIRQYIAWSQANHYKI